MIVSPCSNFTDPPLSLSLSTDAQHCVSQMPVVLIPIHFDRNPNQRPALPSCQRSLVVRTFITSDFMTGVPATPGKQLPINVRLRRMCLYKNFKCVRITFL